MRRIGTDRNGEFREINSRIRRYGQRAKEREKNLTDALAAGDMRAADRYRKEADLFKRKHDEAIRQLRLLRGVLA